MNHKKINATLSLLCILLLLCTIPCFAAETQPEGTADAGSVDSGVISEPGTTAASCAVDGHRISEEKIIYPTQTEEGFVTGICEICGQSVTIETLPPEAQRSESRMMGDVTDDGHVHSKDARAILRAVSLLEKLPGENLAYADLDADGLISSKDARMALRVVAKLDGPIRHSFTIDIKNAPTCTEKGALFCRCDYCGAEEDLTLPANGHSFRYDVTLEPTCTEKGRANAICSVCGLAQDTELPAAGHRFGEPKVQQATCTADGKSERVCTVCGEQETTVLKAAGHQWQAATLTTPERCAVCGRVKTGWTPVGGKWVYFEKDGKTPSGKKIINGELGGQNAPRYTVNGVYDPEFRGAVTCSDADWIVAAGIAAKVATEADRTLFRAFGEVAKATTPDMTKEEKLRACFDYVKTAYRESRPRTPHYTGIDWPIVYANDMFVRGTGNCFSYAAAFAYMAKAIGYENVYGCSSGGHGWAEIDGLVYDPEWSKTHHKYSYFALSYNTRTDVRYKEAIASPQAWMHVKI